MKLSFTILFALISKILLSQVSGNINYQNQVRFPDANINIPFPSGNDLILNVKGLNNVKADAYVAIFNVTQVGKTTEEVNRLIGKRIKDVENSIQTRKEATVFIDMISFVPMYEFEREKKIFRKDTYQEIPIGFEVKKNLHIKYDNPDFLDELIRICAKSEIYDLVRVDYFATNLEEKKKELSERAASLLEAKIQRYEATLGKQFDSLDKVVVDGFRVSYPVEKYKSYQAYSSSSLNLKKNAQATTAQKSTTLYYQPIVDKEFDFVINPVILEPVIQIIYEVKIKVKLVQKEKIRPGIEYRLITPNGEVKKLDIKN